MSSERTSDTTTNDNKYLDKAVGLPALWAKIKSLLNTKADDSSVVHKTGDETITGVKSFSEIKTPTISYGAANGVGTTIAYSPAYNALLLRIGDADSSTQIRIGMSGIDFCNKNINNVKTPISDLQAANKTYVDTECAKKATVISSTEDLTDGVSELETGKIYVVYEE